MTFLRKNVWESGGDWGDPVLWYARGVKALKARALKDRTSWKFFGAIHGFDPQLWEQVGYLAQNEPPPSNADANAYWQQCQHGSWYFLPWHRGYLMALEAVLRDVIVKANGPKDWALPYWNYFKPSENLLPPAFASKDWPDGTGDNPLYVEQRYGPDWPNGSKVYVPLDQVNLDALNDQDFVGPGAGANPGFGGVNTGFEHSGGTHGGVESQPHDLVHVFVGGGDQNTIGLMAWPDLAGLDPIFYLHHANIDRLWEVWKKVPGSKGDPTQPKWVKGPASIGEHAFEMPKPDGGKWTYTPGDMGDLSKLDYTYDDLSPPSVTPELVARLRGLGASVPTVESVQRRPAMPPPATELLGATESVPLVGGGASAALALNPTVKAKVAASLNAVRTEAPGQAAEPDRVYLNLENVRGLDDATVFDVYVNVPPGQDPAQHPELKAGSVALFGVRKASASNDAHAGNGLNFVLNISSIVDALHMSSALNASELHVQLVPRRPVPEAAQISIGRISAYRRGE
ncbi:MAG TPA: tyrosinase family protein [Roseiarcus sp.]|nr:tyrosinase family protein [Roseiarcus sp.]